MANVSSTPSQALTSISGEMSWSSCVSTGPAQSESIITQGSRESGSIKRAHSLVVVHVAVALMPLPPLITVQPGGRPPPKSSVNRTTGPTVVV